MPPPHGLLRMMSTTIEAMRPESNGMSAPYPPVMHARIASA